MYDERQGLVVWCQSLKHVRKLRTYGHVQYVSKKMKYVILYCNKRDAGERSAEIEQLPFVNGVEWSQRSQLDMNFQSETKDAKASRPKAENIHM